jgi:Ankyrin repeats (3 copies)
MFKQLWKHVKTLVQKKKKFVFFHRIPEDVCRHILSFLDNERDILYLLLSKSYRPHAFETSLCEMIQFYKHLYVNRLYERELNKQMDQYIADSKPNFHKLKQYIIQDHADLEIICTFKRNIAHFLCQIYEYQNGADMDLLVYIVKHIKHVNQGDLFGQTIFHCTCIGIKKQRWLHSNYRSVSLEVLKVLHRYRGHELDVNLLDMSGRSALSFLIERKESDVETIQCLKFVLKHFTLDIKQPFQNGCLLIHEIVRRSYVDILPVLMEKGESIDAQNVHGKTPLMLAVEWGEWEMFEEIMKYRPNIHSVDENGNTALMQAVWNEYESMALELLKCGANAHHRNRQGATAITWASENKRLQRILMEGNLYV